MMPLHSYFVLTAFTFLLIILILQIIRLRKFRSEFLGAPTIKKRYFYAGKIAIFTTWALFIVKAISPGLGYLSLPVAFSWVAVGLLYTGAFIMAVSMIKLGKSLKVGLPAGETILQTTGIYRVSRNPLYCGVHLIAIASCIYFPDLLNLTLTVFGIYIHHMIIIREEQFLSHRFGKAWLIYSTRVSRYL
ncbi:MAG: methyltransferase [bacterium]